MNTRALANLSARLLAVGFALGAAACLVLNAQRRANPEPAPEPDEPVAESDAAVPPDALPLGVEAPAAPAEKPELTEEELFLFTSKSLPPAAVTGPEGSPETFILGSKSGILELVDEDAAPAPPPTFLPSSKVLVVDPGFQNENNVPVFLHSSKDTVLDLDVGDRFLRSSKSGVLVPLTEPAKPAAPSQQQAVPRPRPVEVPKNDR